MDVFLGYQGMQGSVGFPGPQGFKGEKGFQGAPGLTGLGKNFAQLNDFCDIS